MPACAFSRSQPGQGLYPGGVTGSKNIVVKGNFFSTEFFAGCGFYGLNASTHWHYGHGDVWSGNVWANGRNAGHGRGGSRRHLPARD